MQTDITNLLAANGKPKTAAHCISVAKTNREIATRFGLDETAAFHSALLNDISGIIKSPDMLDYAVRRHWEIDASERKYPILLHQRLSAVLAKEWFGINDGVVLSAIECHTTLRPDPSDYDMALFLADKLSWDQEGMPPFYDVVSSALNQSLRRASLTYIHYALDSNMILAPHRRLIDAKRWLENHC
jgi:predicted HD superfamily hydrolase involved in NAD metabolism